MEIIEGKHSGFCFGVTNAVKLVTDCVDKNIYTLGEIIHNPLVVERLNEKGVKVITEEEIDGITEGTIVVRSHGTTKEIIDKLYSKNINVIDATCVFVKKIHEKVEKYHNLGFKIVIIGTPNHPEIIGTNGWCNNDALIIDDDNTKFDLNIYEKVCVVAQTTYSKEKFNKILKNLSFDKCKMVEIFDTICYTTLERQGETQKISKIADAMIVIGGRTSANTKELFNICKENCSDVYFIENVCELDFEALKKFNKIGIVAGASTPRELIKEVIISMSENIKETKAGIASMEAEISMDDVVNSIPEKKEKYRIGQKVKATIALVSDEGLSVLIAGQKTEKMIPANEISIDGSFDKSKFNLGDEIEVAIASINPLSLSLKAIEQQQIDDEKIVKIENGEEFTMVFNASNKGGLIGKLGSYTVFVPASEIRIGYVEKIDTYVGKTLKLQAKEIDKSKKKIIASQKAVLLNEKEAKKALKEKKEQEFLASLEQGQIVSGKVVRIADFGAFVSVKGFDCLAHKTDLSWASISKCEDVIEIGSTYDFKVLKVDAENKKVSLGLKQLQPHPWQLASEKYAVGDTVTCKVVRIADFGAFVEVEKGIEGLIHVSQITYDWIEKVEGALTIGQEVQAKIIELDTASKKMTLSIKALLPEPEKTENEESEQPKKSYNPAKFARKTDEVKKEQPKKERPAKKQKSETPTEWISDSSNGVSIGELLGNFFDDNE